jgi:Tfp pilus assembly protein PilV
MGRKNERGLSLIEVILALGLLGGVLISIAGMFILSERQVKSGKTATGRPTRCSAPTAPPPAIPTTRR